ncbi:MAG TPA: vWA domain-containing protein [Methanocella sp.]|nr:vWA domain-containing protein [Methanocella sp.]
MLFADEKKVRAACAQCLASPADARANDDLVTGCRSIGRTFLRLYNIVPPMMERMIYTSYQGTGIINFSKSIDEFCNRGKNFEGMVTRQRRRDVKKVRFAVLYDDSNSMTAWWRNLTMSETISEADSPQTYAKVACLSLMEGLGRDAEINLWKFGTEARGPYNLTTNMYREVVASNGSGGSRLDLALKSVQDNGWDKRPGAKIMVIITDGIPEVGRSVYAEDVLASAAALDTVRTLIHHKVHVLYLQLMTDESRRHRKSGGYTMVEYGKEVERIGCIFMTVGTKDKIQDSMFKGLHTVMHRL